MVLETGRGRGGSKTTENKNLKTVFFSAVMLVGWPLFYTAATVVIQRRQ